MVRSVRGRRGGLHGRGGHVWQGGLCAKGVCMAGGGVHGRRDTAKPMAVN